ncbi:MAG: TonB-dependent receptor, partial [Bacteroidota bacterium]
IQLLTNAKELGTIVVSSSRYEKKISEETVSMEVIKPSLIENTNSVDMEEAINKAPGVNVVDGQANIRGGSGYSYGAGSRVLVLVDDVPQLAADAGDVKWDFLPLENVDQVEIIKGAASSLYGSSALNGVINIRTNYPTSVPKTTINFYQGIYMNPKRKELIWWGNKQPYFSGGYFNHSQKFGQFDLCFGGNVYNESGFREGEYIQRGRVNVGTRYRFKKIDGLAVCLNINSFVSHTCTFFIWQDDSLNAYRPQGGTDTATTTLAENNNTRISIDPYLTYFNKNGNRHSFHGRYYLTNAIATDNKSTNAQLYYGEYQYQHFLKFGLNITTGVAANASVITADLYGDHHADNEALFLQMDQKKGRLNIVGGIRYEMFRVDTITNQSPILLRAGLNFRLMKATYFRASFGQGYRFPTIAEKFVATQVGPLKIFPNPTVNPETGWSSEIGVKQGFKLSSWLGYLDLCAFMSEYKDFMEFTFGYYPPFAWAPPQPITFNYLGFKTINITDARISGGEFTVIGQGKLFGLPTNLLAGVNYIIPIDVNKIALVDSLLKENSGAPKSVLDSLSKIKILNYRYQWTAKAEFDISYHALSTGFSFRYNSFMDNIDPIFNGTDPLIPVQVVA